jgi:hypothetical protein
MPPPSYCHIDQSNGPLPHKNIVQPRWPHGRHDSLGECVEIQIDLFARRRCSNSSACRLLCQGRRPERGRVGLFHGKRFANREWRAAGSGGDDRRAPVISVRIQDSSHQSPQWTLGGGHGQRSRPVRARAHRRRDAGGGAGSRIFRAGAGYGRSRIGETPRPPSENAMDHEKRERFPSPVDRKPLRPTCAQTRIESILTLPRT